MQNFYKDGFKWFGIQEILLSCALCNLFKLQSPWEKIDQWVLLLHFNGLFND